MRGSIIVLMIFAAGIFIGLGGIVTGSRLPADLGEWLLYALIIQIGLNLGYGGNIRMLIKRISWRAMFLPLATIVGTLLFSVLAGLCLGEWSVTDSLALGSGLGYYSLSSVLIIDIKSHLTGVEAATRLGMLALLVNIVREMTALICGPWFAKVFGKYAPISAAGVTSIDVTLPMIIRCVGTEAAPMALIHGMVLEISVPLLVTLFAGL